MLHKLVKHSNINQIKHSDTVTHSTHSKVTDPTMEHCKLTVWIKHRNNAAVQKSNDLKRLQALNLLQRILGYWASL